VVSSSKWLAARIQGIHLVDKDTLPYCARRASAAKNGSGGVLGRFDEVNSPPYGLPLQGAPRVLLLLESHLPRPAGVKRQVGQAGGLGNHQNR
jgi:hypothetical protein